VGKIEAHLVESPETVASQSILWVALVLVDMRDGIDQFALHPSVCQMCPDGSVLEVVAVLYLVEDSQTIFALVLEACAHVHSERRLYHASVPYHF
jgi:hypothetical protein